MPLGAVPRSYGCNVFRAATIPGPVDLWGAARATVLRTPTRSPRSSATTRRPRHGDRTLATREIVSVAQDRGIARLALGPGGCAGGRSARPGARRGHTGGGAVRELHPAHPRAGRARTVARAAAVPERGEDRFAG